MKNHPVPSTPVAEEAPLASPPAFNITASAVRLKSILVPTDFSDESRKALHHAVTLAKGFGAQIILLHVCKALTYPGVPNFVLPMDLDKIVTQNQKQLDLMCQRERVNSGLQVFRLVHVSDSPGEEITQAGKNLKADLIVIAAHRHAALRDALLGGTAEYVIHHASCSVLVMPPNGRDGDFGAE